MDNSECFTTDDIEQNVMKISEFKKKCTNVMFSLNFIYTQDDLYGNLVSLTILYQIIRIGN